MMYQSKMAVAVKSKGRVLRERGETVFLPFGCEYSLLIKNLNSVKAKVKIWIDGTDVTEGTSGLIVPANDEVELERFIKNGNLHAGNRFKFIERTAQISNHRGNKIDDGLIRVEFEFEQQKPAYVPPPVTVWPTHHHHHYHDRYFLGSNTVYGTAADSSIARGISDVTSTSLGDVQASYNASAEGGAASLSSHTMRGAEASASAGANTRLRSASKGLASRVSTQAAPAVETDVGITVAGSESHQAFSWGSYFPTDGVKHAMVLRMLGEVEGQPVVAPVTVAHKPTCTSCGKVNKATSRFCSECGTALNIIG